MTKKEAEHLVKYVGKVDSKILPKRNYETRDKVISFATEYNREGNEKDPSFSKTLHELNFLSGLRIKFSYIEMVHDNIPMIKFYDNEYILICILPIFKN